MDFLVLSARWRLRDGRRAPHRRAPAIPLMMAIEQDPLLVSVRGEGEGKIS